MKEDETVRDRAWRLLAEKLEYVLFALARYPRAVDNLPECYVKIQAIAQVCMGEIEARRAEGKIGPPNGPPEFLADFIKEQGQ